MPKPRGKVEFYVVPENAGVSSKPKWYWHITASNGRTVADGSESYSSKARARQGFAAAIRIATEHLSSEGCDRSKKARNVY